MSTFRKEYRQLSAEEKALVEAIKSKAEELEALFVQAHGQPREMALARTNLEQSVMWATKGIT